MGPGARKGKAGKARCELGSGARRSVRRLVTGPVEVRGRKGVRGWSRGPVGVGGRESVRRLVVGSGGLGPWVGSFGGVKSV